DHAGRDVHADDPGGAALLEPARVVALAASQVEHASAGHVAQQQEEVVLLHVQPPRRFLRLLVTFSDLVVVGGHRRAAFRRREALSWRLNGSPRWWASRMSSV